MRRISLTLTLLSLALLGGCAPYALSYDYDVTTSFARYKTFDYYTSKKGTQGTTGLMDKRVRAAVEKELKARGFIQETKTEPDFLVTYYPVMQEQRYRTTTHMAWGTGWGRRPFSGGFGTSLSREHSYQEGTLVIEIVDFKSNQVIWHGAAAGALTGLATPEDANEVVPKAVHDILDKFPPK